MKCFKCGHRLGRTKIYASRDVYIRDFMTATEAAYCVECFRGFRDGVEL